MPKDCLSHGHNFLPTESKNEIDSDDWIYGRDSDQDYDI